MKHKASTIVITPCVRELRELIDFSSRVLVRKKCQEKVYIQIAPAMSRRIVAGVGRQPCCPRRIRRVDLDTI